MSPRTLLILAVAAVIALGGGWYFGAATVPAEQRSVEAGKLMFPDLVGKLKDAARIEVVHQDKVLGITRKGDRWGLDDRGGYPVQDTKLRGMLTALTELRLTEPRTADPAQFSRLGVEDAEGKDANANRLKVLDGAGKPVVDVIVGHRRVRTQGNVPEQVYVRRPGDNQVWLAEGNLQVDYDVQLWFDRDVMNIDHKKITKVTVTHGDQTLLFAPDGDKLVLTDPAEHPKLEDYKVEDVARALEFLTFQDVQPADKPAGEAVGQGVFSTTDGQTITAAVFRGDKDIWVKFTVAGDDKLAAKLAGWSYQLGSWKEKALVPTLDDLKAPEKTDEKPEK